MRSLQLTFSLLSNLLLLLCFIYKNGPVEGSNILFFHLGATSSHRTAIWPLTEKLADKGHKITYIFGVEKKIGSHPNVEEITPSKMVQLNSENIAEFDINMRLNNTVHKLYEKAFTLCFDLCKGFYDSPEIHEWMNRPGLHYDLIMIDSSMGECIYGIVHKFKAKHVIFVPAVAPHHWDGFGMVPETSSIPPTVSFLGVPPKPSEMNLYGRLWSTVEHLIWRLGFVDYSYKIKRLIEEKMNITSLPDLGEFERNASLVLLNTHFIEDYAMSLPPMIIPFSGLWCSKDKMKDRKPLPNELAKFVEQENSDGFVYVSFGSSVVASGMPTELRNSFFKAFESFPKLKFLWRWTGEIPEDKPKNVLLQSWYPQHDLLGHPKIKGFIMQAGRPSTQEALCHGTPLITIPIFGDQDYNADRLEFIGASIKLDITNITSDSLKDAIRDLVYTEKYKRRISQLSIMFKDRPIDILENTLFWIEYVLRHDDTSLLKPLSMNKTWYQRRLLDVYLVLAGIIFSVIVTVIAAGYLVIKCALRYCVGGNNGLAPRNKKYD